jgi:small subunit ribosomal protein S9
MAETEAKTGTFIQAVGRRRESVARVRVYKPTTTTVNVFENEYKAGDIVVNGKQIAEYFRFDAHVPVYRKIFEVTDTLGKYVVSVKVTGGGLHGQMEAMLMGIARVFDKMDPEAYHSILREHGYLTRDARTRERRKVGNAGKARRRKSSPKR